MDWDSGEEFDPNPFNFKPLKRRRLSKKKLKETKRSNSSKPSDSQRNKYVQKTLQFGTDQLSKVKAIEKQSEVLPSSAQPSSGPPRSEVKESASPVVQDCVIPSVPSADCRDVQLSSTHSPPTAGDVSSPHLVLNHHCLTTRSITSSSSRPPPLRTSTQLSCAQPPPSMGQLSPIKIKVRRRKSQQACQPESPQESQLEQGGQLGEARTNSVKSGNNLNITEQMREHLFSPNNNNMTGQDDILQPPGPSDTSRVPKLGLEPDEKSDLSEDVIFVTVAEKDSQELEMGLSIKPTIHCSSVNLKIPLNKTDSGKEKPVQISAVFSDVKSPGKQRQISDYFGKSKPSPKTQKQNWDEFFRIARSRNQKKSQEHQQAKDTSMEKTSIKTAPFYKTIKNTNLSVDAFAYGDLPHVKYYLLSHFHYDHYQGLTKHWRQPIVCSSVTKRLLIYKLKVRESLIFTLDVGETKKFGDCLVTALDANHCPGSVMFLIQLTTGLTALHTGDFRATPEMESLPEFWQSTFRVDLLYLDTTYCRPEYDFPSQPDVIDKTLHLVKEFLVSRPNTVLMVGAYVIGKERIFKAIAEGLDCKVWGDTSRTATWRCLQDDEILSRLVEDRARAQLHVISNGQVNWGKLGREFDKVKSAGGWGHVLGVKPTGWSHSRGERAEASLINVDIVTRGQVSLLEVPYSEHSSYGELERFVKFLRLGSEKNIVDTVSRNQTQRENVRTTFRKWIQEANLSDLNVKRYRAVQ